MGDAERSELAQKLQKDLEDHISQLKPKKYEDGWPEDRWEEEMEKHPAFMTKPVAEGQQLPPLVEALQQLKYDPDVNSPDELASSYKEDGNQNFKRKKYRWAVESYTKGLEANSENKDLNAALHLNRAAAHFHIGNFQKALRDATQAKILKSNYRKAIERGAMCCFELKLFEDCTSWCDEGLELDVKDETFLRLKKKAIEKKRRADLEKRKEACLALKQQKEMEALEVALKERDMNVSREDLEPSHPSVLENKVHLDKDGKLIWPVFFLYPEYCQSDCIKGFHEDASLLTHLDYMFGKNHPDWDEKKDYVPEKLQAYCFEREEKMVEIDKRKALKEILRGNRIKIKSGVPCFLITVANSEFDKKFRLKNEVSES